MPEHKMVCLGMDGVGKSAITVRFLQGTFMEKYDPTVEDSYRKNVQIENIHYVVEILDTAGSDLMAPMKDLYMKDGQGFILVYDITNRKSFEALEKIREDIVQVTKNEKFPCIVVGNKADLSELREVSTDEGSAWTHRFDDCTFMEMSAKMSPNIEEIFLQLLRQILKAEEMKSREPAPAPAVVEEQAPPKEEEAKPGKKSKKKGDGKKDDCVIS